MSSHLRTREETARDEAAFRTVLAAVRDKLDTLEAACVENEPLRDAVRLSLNHYLVQLDLLEQACHRANSDQKGTADSDT